MERGAPQQPGSSESSRGAGSAELPGLAGLKARVGGTAHTGLLPQVPWDDLRYLFGEIMYGGHITDDWDRRLCRTYLAEYIRMEMLEGEVQLAPGFQIPSNLDYKVGRGAPTRGLT